MVVGTLEKRKARPQWEGSHRRERRVAGILEEREPDISGIGSANKSEG